MKTVVDIHLFGSTGEHVISRRVGFFSSEYLAGLWAKQFRMTAKDSGVDATAVYRATAPNEGDFTGYFDIRTEDPSNAIRLLVESAVDVEDVRRASATAGIGR